MSRPRRDREREADLLRRARGSLIALRDFYEEARLRGPSRSVHKALTLLDFIKGAKLDV